MVAAFTTALRVAGDMLLADTSRMSLSSPQGQRLQSLKDGRERAAYFEKEILTPFLEEESEAIKAAVNAALAALPGPWRFEFVEFTEEEKPRAGRDYWLVMKATRRRYLGSHTIQQMVNAKYTGGSREDNTGGVVMASWALLASEDAKGINGTTALSQAYSDLDKLADEVTDYFFWVFLHDGEAKTAIATSLLVDTLLSPDPATCMRYNSQQSWPSIQMNHNKGAANAKPLPTVREARLRLIRWLHNEQAKNLLEVVRTHQELSNQLGLAAAVAVKEESD